MAITAFKKRRRTITMNEISFAITYIGGAVGGVCGALFIGGILERVLYRMCKPYRRILYELGQDRGG